MVGEPFRVQYVLEEVSNREFYAPAFKDFRFVNGPEVHEGWAHAADGARKLRNILYTLEAIKPGKFMIPRASAKTGDHWIRSDIAWLEVISKAEAVKRGLQPAPVENDAPYFLGPAEDPYDRIRDNLFLKVKVDKKACFVGEAVTATFTLYSRLMSRSDIVKNPGFYGFTVQDMIGLDDHESVTEVINGKRFDVHTIRKVQLYPLQAGLFTIDPMEVTNKVEFSRSVVNKRPEQEISEGNYPDKKTSNAANTEVYESSMSTPSIPITVRPAPVKNRPADFTGATGRFGISAAVAKTSLVKNEQGQLIITVSGQGNFTQLVPPVVHWPAGIEGFEPQATDSLDHTRSPLKGNKVFRFPFISSRPGRYTIPAVHFSFFDPDSNTYKTVSTRAIAIVIDERQDVPAAGPLQTKKDSERSNDVILFLAGLVLFTMIGLWILYYKKRKAIHQEQAIKKEENAPTVDSMLQPAAAAMADDRLFYTTLRSSIWKFLSTRFGLEGSRMNHQQLLATLREQQVDDQYGKEITGILQQCETGIFAGAYTEADKKELLEKTTRVLEQIAKGHS